MLKDMLPDLTHNFFNNFGMESRRKFKCNILLFSMSHQVQCLHKITIMLISGKYLPSSMTLYQE